MKNMPSYLLLVTLLSGCIIAINENNYRILSDKDKKLILPFDSTKTGQKVSSSDNSTILYEINSNDMKHFAADQKFTWVHLWRPYCGADHCQNINYYNQIVEKHKSDSLKFLLVSLTYDLKTIHQITKNSNYNMPVFVLQDSHYGHKLQPGTTLLYSELTSDSLSKDDAISATDYFFMDSTLIYIGNGSDTYESNIIDSLISSNQK